MRSGTYGKLQNLVQSAEGCREGGAGEDPGAPQKAALAQAAVRRHTGATQEPLWGRRQGCAVKARNCRPGCGSAEN